MSSIIKMQFLMCLKLFPFFVWLISSAPFLAEAAINLPENITIPAVISLGDSILDTGNNNYIKTIAKCNFPPYGQDFMGGKPTGRFSNGKVLSDLIAEELGVKPVLPAYLDPSLQDQDLLTGVSFASGGSGYDPLTPQILSVIPFSDQLEYFGDYIGKLNKIAGEERSSKILRESLIVVDSGINDFVNNYYGVTLRRFHYDVSSYIKLLVGHASSIVQNLYRSGARRFLVLGVPPIGCLPFERTLRGELQRNCVHEYNSVAQLYNEKLSIELTSINTQFRDILVVYGDFYNLPFDIIVNPQKYGFEIGDKGCCGTGTIELGILCKYACSNVSEYVFWDSIHPTERTYRLIVHDILEKFIESVRGKSF